MSPLRTVRETDPPVASMSAAGVPLRAALRLARGTSGATCSVIRAVSCAIVGVRGTIRVIFRRRLLVAWAVVIRHGSVQRSLWGCTPTIVEQLSGFCVSTPHRERFHRVPAMKTAKEHRGRSAMHRARLLSPTALPRSASSADLLVALDVLPEGNTDPANTKRAQKSGVCAPSHTQGSRNTHPTTRMSGGDLLSHTLPSAVPSAQSSLATGFGMETGRFPDAMTAVTPRDQPAHQPQNHRARGLPPENHTVNANTQANRSVE